MNTNRTLITSLVAGAALVAGGMFAAAQATTGSEAVPVSSSASTVAVDADVATALRFAREEERMARDLYATLADRYDGAAPFAMITHSEQQHFDAVGRLLDRYKIADPARDARPVATPTPPSRNSTTSGWSRAKPPGPWRTTSASPSSSATSPTSRTPSPRSTRLTSVRSSPPC